MKSKKNRTKAIIILLVALLGLGYAYINSDLNINGTAQVKNANWDIYWANVQVTSGSVTGTHVVTAPTISNNTTVNYSVILPEPGTYYEFTVDAVNGGVIDAMIDGVDSKLNGATITTLPDYLRYTITYGDGVELEANHELKASTTETYKVRVEYRDDIELNQIPASDQTLSLQFTVTYRQATDDSAEVPHARTIYTANVYDSNDEDNTVVWIGQTIPSTIIQHQTPALAMAALKQASGGSTDRPFFLRHTVQNNLVTESYVGFVITSDMVSQAETEYITNCYNDQECIDSYQGATAGTYYLKGKNTLELVNGAWQCKSEYDDGNGNCLDPGYNANKTVLLNAFGSSNCTDYSSYLGCLAGGLDAGAYSNGDVYAHDDSWGCGVDHYGISECDY